MRRYIVVLVFMAILIGSLFRASAQTGVRLMNMFATIGIFLFGVVGTLALNRWQTTTGLKEVQEALKSLEPDWVITDWAGQGGGRPDYLLVGPGGIVSVCLDDTPQSTWARIARKRIAKSWDRAEASVSWLRDRMRRTEQPLHEAGPEVPVAAVLVLTRRRAEPEAGDAARITVNAAALADQIRRFGMGELLDERTRFKLTRAFRSA